jgi:hypothetical protein
MVLLATSYDWVGQMLVLLAGWSSSAILLLISIVATCIPKRRRTAKRAAMISATLLGVCLSYYGYLTLFAGISPDSFTLYWIVGPMIGAVVFWTLNDYLLNRSDEKRA